MYVILVKGMRTKHGHLPQSYYISSFFFLNVHLSGLFILPTSEFVIYVSITSSIYLGILGLYSASDLNLEMDWM